MILKLIRQYLSPEQASGYSKLYHQLSISHETFYRFIYADKARHLKYSLVPTTIPQGMNLGDLPPLA